MLQWGPIALVVAVTPASGGQPRARLKQAAHSHKTISLLFELFDHQRSWSVTCLRSVELLHQASCEDLV